MLRDNIYDALRADILACKLAPGEEIREQDLAAQYEVSRAPIRDALLRLENDRLITVHPRQGYRVNPISITDAQEMFQLRLWLETACVTIAAEQAPPDILESLDQYRVHDPAQDFIDYNRAFHRAIAAASGNKRMAAAANELIDQGERLVRVSLANVKGHNPTQLVTEHIALISAIQARDVRNAARIIREHITKAERRVMSALGRSAIIS
ncbi:MAG: GntR family transcriptional regulator [Burkholderiales bacterium]|nr:GntR family transcriptional regulator [Burkholderiales bacterium]